MRLHTAGGATRPPTPVLVQPSKPNARPPFGIDQGKLHDVITDRRARIASLEAAMVSVCERAAAQNAPGHVLVDDRETWDDEMWSRYLGAAAAAEPEFMSPLLRLHSEVERLERLMALPAFEHAQAA